MLKLDSLPPGVAWFFSHSDMAPPDLHLPSGDCPPTESSPIGEDAGVDTEVPGAPPEPYGEDRCTRAVTRQGSSAVAYAGEEPRPDDPLLAFAPFLHKQPRRNSITPDLQRRFVAVLAATGIVQQAACSIGKSMEALYKLRARPGAEGFAAAWDEALDWGLKRLEDCAIERALASDDPAANAMLCFVLGRRELQLVDIRDLEPGHPIYESIRAEVLEGVEAFLAWDDADEPDNGPDSATCHEKRRETA